MEEAVISANQSEEQNWQMPLVSIVMPIYNAEEYLVETLDGLAKQTLTDFEVIFVDDGSQDGTMAVLEDFAQKDSRARILRQDHRYAGAAMNLGMQYVRGKYLLFLDADDCFMPKMLETAVGKAERTGSDICVFRANGMNDETGKISSMPWTMVMKLCPRDEIFSLKTNAKYIYAFTVSAPWNKLYRTDFVRKYGLTFQQGIRQATDMAFTMTSLALASGICAIDEDLLTYRFHNKKSLQGSNDYWPECFFEALKELKRRLVAYGVYEQVEAAFLNYVVEISFYNLMTLRTASSFAKTFLLIRNEIFDQFGIRTRPDNYFYAYYRLAERRNDLLALPMYDFFMKWSTMKNFWVQKRD